VISFHQEGYCVRRQSQAWHPIYLAGVPNGPCRGWENGPGTLHRRIPYPPNLAGVPDDPCRG